MSFDSSPDAPPPPDPAPGAREVTDPKAMRALAHPLRLELLEQLTLAGTLTAAQAGELVGETPANCSFHLRTLAKYGFVEEAAGGRGRERPWQRVAGGIGTPEVLDGTEASVSGRALTDVIVNRHLETIRKHRAVTQPGLPAEWQQLSGHSSAILHLTLEETGELRTDLLALLARYADRTTRPAASRPVQMFTYTMPGPAAAPTDEESRPGSPGSPDSADPS
ncbi:winged helix-turn-helix domain-containing protein [Streptomyces sp. NPDC057137]|uniref:winged helix-turn-helix domain-containing protein n=1 Tax=Streptomyces sp. NPDC057137 TaxID=3346030 RepID=UPI003626D406